MSTAATISVDEFQALEQKVLRAVDLIKKEREARAVAEAEAAASKAEATDLREKLEAAGAARTEADGLTREREAIKQRVEKMIAQMDELL